MTTFVPFGSTPLASDRLPDEQMYANDGSFVRGVRAGVYGMGSGLRNAAGAVADAFDYDNFAAQQYGEADRLAQKAGRVGPRISSLKQLGEEGYSLGNIGDYALGTMGSALPSMGVGIGATLASGGALLPSLAASTLAYTPMEMGDAVAKWRQANPGQQVDGDTAARLGLTGLASAGAQSIVPAAVGGKLAGRGLASAPVAGFKQATTRNLAEIPMEGFTEGLGEGIKQVGATPEAPLDWEQIRENAVAGAIGGAPMAGVGTLGDYAHGNRQAVADTASRAAKAVGKALEPAQRAAEDAKTATEKGFGDAWTAMSDLGESAWKGFSDSDLGKTLNERVANTQQRVRAILDDPEVPAEWKAKVEAAAKTAGNKTSAAMVLAVDGTRNKIKQAREEGIRKTTLDTLRSSVDAVINGDYLGNKADLADGTDQQVSTRLRESAAKAMGAAKAWGEDLLRRKDVDDATKAEVNDAMGNPDDPTGPQRVAAKWKLYDAKDKIVQGFQDIKARFKKGFDSASEDPNAPKKSEDYSGVRAVIGEALRPHMVRINEVVGKDPKALEEVADSLRTYIEAVTDAEGKKTDAVDRGFARMKLTQLLGDDAAGIMADVAEAVGQGQTREQTDRVFEELNELQALQRSHGDLVKMMTRVLPRGQRNEVSRDIERVVEWATGADVRGKDASQNEIKFRNQKMETDLQRKYGAKAKAIMTQVEQMLSPKQGARYDPEADRLAAEQDGVDYEAALTEKDDPAESSFFGSGANRKGLVLNPEVHAAKNPAFAGKGTANELIKKLQIENPDAQVKFVALTDRPEMLDRIPAEKRRVTMEAKRLEQEMPGAENAEKRQKALQAFRDARVVELKQDGMGMVEVSRLPNGKLTADEIDAMRMDTNSYGAADHPSRLEIKPAGADKAEHVFDAVAVTRTAMKRINREREWTKGDDIDQLTRMGRAFSDGVAALMQEFGRFKIASGLVIGHINGRPITAREALEVDKRTDKDLRTDAQTMEAADIRKRLRELEGAAESKADAKAVRDEIKELRGRLKYLENSRQGRTNSDLAAKTIEDMEAAVRAIDRRLNGIGKAGEGKVDPARQRVEDSIRTMEDLLNRTTDDAKRKDIETVITTLQQSLDGERNVIERGKLMKEREYLMGRLEGAYERAMYGKSFQDGARQDADPNGNIHEASARLSESELQARLNMDGSLKTVPSTYTPSAKALVSVAGRVSAAGGIGETIAKRLFALAFNFAAVSKKDQYTLLELRGATKPSDVGEVVNQMAKKYASALMLTRAQSDAIERMMEMAREGGDPGTAYTSVEQANSLIGQQVAGASIERLTKMLEDHQRRLARYEEKGGTSEAVERVMNAMRTEIGWMQDRMETLQQQAPAKPKTQPKLRTGREKGEYSTPVMGPFAKEGLPDQKTPSKKKPAAPPEGTPDPKAVAAKKAAFLERAASGDKALIKELQTSTDLKGLQRAVAALNEADTAPDVVQIINNRLRELVKDEGQAYHAQTRKYSLLGVKPQENSSPEQRLNDRLTSLLAERGIRVEQAAFEGVPVEMRVSLINRALQVDPGQPMAQDVARFLSWMTIGSEFYESIAQGISGSKFEADITVQVNRDARQSLYTPARKQREVVRRAVEQLLTNGLYKKHAAEAPLSAKVLQLVRQAIQNILTALGGVKYKELQGIADGFIDGLLAGRVRLERPRAEGTVLLKPYDVFAEDPHAADLTYALTDGKGFALTGSLAYAAKGTVYRQAGAAIHDLDFTTSLSQQSAEQRLEKLYPQASKVRSFGGLGSFVTTYVVPPRGHTVDLMNVQGGVVKGFVVRDADRKIVGRYTNDGKESSSGVKATVVDLIGDSREIMDRMTIPTSFGDRSVPISSAADAMAEKLTYARDKDIADFANFVPFEKGGVQTRKYSLLSTKIHGDLGREGFAATHDSPHRHEGKFDWRNHQGKGEGNAAFGAGTYLSTAQGVHNSYKRQFTATINSEDDRYATERAEEMLRSKLYSENKTYRELADRVSALYEQMRKEVIRRPTSGFDDDGDTNHVLGGEFTPRYYVLEAEQRETLARMEGIEAIYRATSPTYEVSVDIKPEQLLDWDAPLGYQMGESKTLDRAMYEMAFDDRIDTSITVDIGDSGVGAFGEPDPVQVQLAEIFESIINDEPMRYGDLGYATGKDVYKGLTKALGSQAKASDYLQSLGILGHKYAASGGKNDARPNYVIYDDSRITTNYVHFSQDKVNRQQYPNAGPSEPLNAKAIRDHLFKVLGDTVQVEFANLMYAGDFTRQDGEDIIRISVHALNPTTVAYHESLHAFFQQLKDKGLPDVVQAVFKGLNTPHIMRQLRERLKDSPEALAQLSDPEERAAYAYQFWASDPTFKLTAAPRTVFEKIAAAIRKVLGIWSNDERALEIFEYFHSGKYQQQSASKLAIHTATMRAGRNSTVDTAAHMVKPLKKLGDAIVGAGGERLRDSGIPALRELADLIKLRGTDEGRDGGFIQAARLARTEHMNWLATHLQEYGADALDEALEAMQAGRKASTTQAKIVQKLVQEKFLRQMMFDKYLPDAGVKLGDLGPDYFPRVWDPAYISKNQEAFAEMLESYGVKNVDAVIQKIVSGNGTEWGFDDNAQIEIERPGFVNARERKMAFISGEDALPFLQKDFWKTMDSYVTQATRRGEWSRRFGYKNERFDALLSRAARQGATAEQIEMARNFAKAVDGTLGDNIDPSYRRLMGNMIVYQNLRLLPLAIFSSLVDPLGVIVRGGTVRDGWNTFKRGIKEMRKSWQKDPSFDADTMLAEEIGTIEDAMLQHTISSMYGQGLMGDTAQKINDLFFRYNLMEGFNRSMRVGATQAALGFIGRHAKGANEHSTRYLAELGLKANEVKFDDDGKVVIDERVKLAVNRWVDGAVLRPNAAETPIWMHDPHYALFAHLKQFAFAFHHTFLKRVWHEYQHGNYKPVMALASFVPMMMAADFVKDMLTNGGDEPEWKRQWTFMDHVGYGVERAGILGVGQFALDGIGDIRHGGTGIGALGGPTLDQLTDAVSVLGGRREFGSFALRSMPANSLYRGYVGPADEMEFEGDSMN